MRILLTHSYFLRLDVKQLNTRTPYPPLATLYAAALLRSKGYEVRVADLQFASAAGIEAHIVEFRPEVLVIYDDGFNYLTKMCLTNMREAAFSMQKSAKRKGLRVIVSSSDASDHAAEYCREGADYVILGEAEYTLLELLKRPAEPALVNGVAFLENGELKKTAARSVSRDLDALPPPAWDLIDLEPYRNAWMSAHGYFSLNLVTTRGCPYKCNWCAKPIYGNRYNSHSPEYVVKLIRDSQAQFGYTHIWFADDIFGLKPGWLRRFAELIREYNIRIRYKIQSRADLLLEDENVRHLAESGCDMVWIGAESGSQRILDAMDKGITTGQIAEAVGLLKHYSIKPALFLQFGYPGENAEDIGRTVKMVMDLLPYDIGVSVSYPLPGTRFFEKVKEELKEKQNWTDSDDLHLMFANSYPAGFYRHLHRYVHNSYRAKQAAQWLKGFSLSHYREISLWPYYKLKSIKEKKALKKFESGAARMF